MTTHDFMCEVERALGEMPEAAHPAHPNHKAYVRLCAAFEEHKRTLEEEMYVKLDDMADAWQV